MEVCGLSLRSSPRMVGRDPGALSVQAVVKPVIGANELPVFHPPPAQARTPMGASVNGGRKAIPIAEQDQGNVEQHCGEGLISELGREGDRVPEAAEDIPVRSRKAAVRWGSCEQIRHDRDPPPKFCRLTPGNTGRRGAWVPPTARGRASSQGWPRHRAGRAGSGTGSGPRHLEPAIERPPKRRRRGRR